MKLQLKEEMGDISSDYKDIYTKVIKDTQDSNRKSGILKYQSKADVEMAKSVLTDMYPNVKIRDLDKNEEEDGSYYIMYSTDLDESFKDLQFQKNLNPTGTPIGSGGGFGESYEEPEETTYCPICKSEMELIGGQGNYWEYFCGHCQKYFYLDREEKIHDDEVWNEDMEIKRYSDVVPKEQRKYWYFTTHGVGPGSIPKGVNVLDMKDGQNDRGTWGTFVCLDAILNTDELKKYDMREMKPTDESIEETGIRRKQFKRLGLDANGEPLTESVDKIKDAAEKFCNYSNKKIDGKGYSDKFEIESDENGGYIVSWGREDSYHFKNDGTVEYEYGNYDDQKIENWDSIEEFEKETYSQDESLKENANDDFSELHDFEITSIQGKYGIECQEHFIRYGKHFNRHLYLAGLKKNGEPKWITDYSYQKAFTKPTAERILKELKDKYDGKPLNEDYWFGEEDGFFTRDDLDEFTGELEDQLSGTGIEIWKAYMEPGNNLEVDWEYEGFEDTFKIRIDMRKIRKPNDLFRYIEPVKSGIFKKCEEYDKYIEDADVNESVEKHDTLNQKIFNGDELDPEVKDKLLEIVDNFANALEQDGVKLDIKDVRIIGSNASYNYTAQSDIDLHIYADLSVYPNNEELAEKVYNAYKSLWNNKYDPIVRGHQVEIYVEPWSE